MERGADERGRASAEFGLLAGFLIVAVTVGGYFYEKFINSLDIDELQSHLRPEQQIGRTVPTDNPSLGPGAIRINK